MCDYQLTVVTNLTTPRNIWIMADNLCYSSQNMWQQNKTNSLSKEAQINLTTSITWLCWSQHDTLWQVCIWALTVQTCTTLLHRLLLIPAWATRIQASFLIYSLAITYSNSISLSHGYNDILQYNLPGDTLHKQNIFNRDGVPRWKHKCWQDHPPTSKHITPDESHTFSDMRTLITHHTLNRRQKIFQKYISHLKVLDGWC